MSSHSHYLRGIVGLLPAVVVALSFVVFGCGSSKDSMEEWESTPAVSASSILEYRVDSLQNENRRMREQLDAVAAENRKLTARNAEVETKLAEAAAPPKVETPPPVSGASGYESAMSKFNARDYEGAITGFEALLNAGIEEGLADNCRYWIGESHYGLRQYKEALKNFQMVSEFKRSGKKADAVFMAGNCQSALGNKAAAKEAYEKVVSDFPTSPLVEKARTKLSKMN
jgi:tol-pal system protein YbgF